LLTSDLVKQHPWSLYIVKITQEYI